MDPKEFDFDLNEILSQEEEEEVVTPSYNQPSAKIDANAAAEVELYRQKLTTMEENMNQLRSLLDAGKKTDFVHQIFSKYSHLDEDTRNMAAELLGGYNQTVQSDMKRMFEVFDTLQKDIIATKKSVEGVQDHISRVQTNIAFEKLIKSKLEKAVKGKQLVTEEAVEAAIKSHFNRYNKDESYFLKVNNIANMKDLSVAKKDHAIGRIIIENFHEEALKRIQKGGKVKEGDLDLKKTLPKDEEAAKVMKTVEKKTEKAGEEEEEKKPTEEEIARAKEANAAAFYKRLGSI